MLRKKPFPQIVVLGGGNGTSVIAGGLAASFPDARITAVVGGGDSGSKTGELRRLFGGIAVGDLRRVLGTVSGNQLGALFSYRFGSADSSASVRRLTQKFIATADHPSARLRQVMEDTVALSNDIPKLGGHTFGNLVLTVLRQDYRGSIVSAVSEAADWLDAQVTVLPIAEEPYDVVLFDDARQIVGEGVIDTHYTAKPAAARVWLTPFVDICMEARQAVISADIVLMAPGSLFTSLLPILGVHGIPEALHRQKQHGGVFVAIGNLLSETTVPGLDLADYLKKLQRQAERSFDYVIYNKAYARIPKELIPLRFDQRRLDPATTPIGAALVGRPHDPDPNDPVASTRSPFAHDSHAVAAALETVLDEYSREAAHLLR